MIDFYNHTNNPRLLLDGSIQGDYKTLPRSHKMLSDGRIEYTCDECSHQRIFSSTTSLEYIFNISSHYCLSKSEKERLLHKRIWEPDFISCK